MHGVRHVLTNMCLDRMIGTMPVNEEMANRFEKIAVNALRDECSPTYVGLTIMVLAVSVLLTQVISKRNALFLAPVVLFPPALWGMIQWRCKISGGYDCGDISIGGISWHLWAALGLLAFSFAFIAIVHSWTRHTKLFDEFGKVLYAGRALAGIWGYVFWVALPISIIHPPGLGGICPDIPLVCHDIPVMGFGGGLWWAGPFFSAAAFGLARCTFSRSRVTR